MSNDASLIFAPHHMMTPNPIPHRLGQRSGRERIIFRDRLKSNLPSALSGSIQQRKSGPKCFDHLFIPVHTKNLSAPDKKLSVRHFLAIRLIIPI